MVFLPASACWTRPWAEHGGDWILIAQRDMGSPPSSPRRVTREHHDRPRHVSQGTQLRVRFQSLSMVKLDQAGAGDPRWVHSRPVQRVVGTVG